LADHDADIVMFDVPRPNNGVRGLDEYQVPFWDALKNECYGA
jgi:hypothetical protein